ncbi:hypothetical protein CF161_18569 [Pseudomonas sp. CF161]|nr:hypothetical protein CF161_18569 [Pseudomonas sp. CF161]
MKAERDQLQQELSQLRLLLQGQGQTAQITSLHAPSPN